jgi:hypothetical protein
MHTGKSYKLFEFLVWTRRDIYRLVVIGVGAVLPYQVVGLTWLAIPWTVVALLGTATFLLPFGMLREFDKLNESVDGVMKGNMIGLVIPFSVLISWLYTSLEQVGESTENPFEGNANDVPISQLCQMIEIDLREMLGETDLPPALGPKNNVIL